MKISKRYLSAAFLLLFLVCTVSDIWAQRNVTYRELAIRNQQPNVSFDFITLPGNNEKMVNFTSIFSFPYDYLPFKKYRNRSSENEFFSTVSLSMEIFEAEDKNFNPQRNNNRNINVEGLEPVGRSFWSDTAFAQNYEQSKSKEEFLSGHISVSLKPGNYHYVLQMKRGEERDSRISRTQSKRVEPYGEMNTGDIIMAEEISGETGNPQLKLSTLGKNVEYAEDFYALAYLPQFDNEANYQLQVISLTVSSQDTSTKNQVYSTELNSDDIRTGIKPRIQSSGDDTYLNLTDADDGFTYALVKIPNSNFPNALYRMTVTEEGEKMPAAQATFRSLWIDMPTSLLSLDVAINMLEYIVDDETLNRLSRGSRAEREKKFREFWNKQDPTPETEFNELMAEYYRRIDYTYENFTTEETLGYNSDRGEIYIKFGPPNDVQRKYPTNDSTTEIWTYDKRKFVFKATTGFGDFKLVSNETR